MRDLINALKRFDSLETVIAELEACHDMSDNADIYELVEYLNNEADYAGLPLEGDK